MERESSQKGNVAARFHDWPDEILLAEYVRTHGERLFNEIVRRHKQTIWSECWSVTHHRQDAEAAAQNTWLVFLQKAAAIQKGESLKHWLRSTAWGEAKNLRKKHQLHNHREQPNGELAQLAAEDNSEWLEIINREVERLPESLRVPFLQHCLEGKTRREVARQLGLPEGTVASRIRMARRILRQRLDYRGITLLSNSG